MMQLALQVYRIETAANGRCFFRDGEAAYLCRRFDVGLDGWKYSQEDFASLAGLSNGGNYLKYSNLSYEECADIIRKYVKAEPVEIMNIFRIVVLNSLTLDDDAHLKTAHSSKAMIVSIILHQPTTSLTQVSTCAYLAPLSSTKVLFKEGMQLSNTRTVTCQDFEEFSHCIGLPKRLIKRELDFFAIEHPLAQELINRSFLFDNLKRITGCRTTTAGARLIYQCNEMLHLDCNDIYSNHSCNTHGAPDPIQSRERVSAVICI